MAKEKKADAADQGEKAGGSKKMILIIIVVAIVAVLLSVGVTWFLLSDGSKEEDKAAEEAAATEAAGPQKALYLDLTPAFVVTYTVNNRQRYMQAFVTALTRDPKAIEVMTQHLPLIRHQLNLLFGEKSFETLHSDEGKQALRQEATEAINQLLEKESPGVKIEQVLFTNFVMQ